MDRFRLLVQWGILVLFLFSAASLRADTVTRLTTWQTGDVIEADAFNAEFDNLVNALNGAIDKHNIDSLALIILDTLDVKAGMRFGNTTRAATLGYVLWGNGTLFVPVTKDSAGIVDKTSRQTITGKKTFSDSASFSGAVAFVALPTATNLFPTSQWQIINKWYADSLGNYVRFNAVDSTARDSIPVLRADITTLDAGQTIARDSLQLLQDSLDAVNTRLGEQNVTALETRFEADSTARDGQLEAKTDTTRFKADSTARDGQLNAKTNTTRFEADSTAVYDSLALKINIATAGGIVSDSLDADTLRSFNFSIPSADSSYQGITKRWIAGETITFGQTLFKGSDGKMYLADADSILTMVAVGVSVTKGSVAANGNVRILTYGYVRCDAWNWTSLGGQYPAGIVFASTTPGAFTQTAPTGTADQDQFLGYAETADVIWFAPSPISIGR